MRPLVTVLVFAVGLAAGITAVVAAPEPPPQDSLPALPAVPEPPAAAVIAAAVDANDSEVLSLVLDQPALESLTVALKPLERVDRVRFTGAARIIAERVAVGYVAYGPSAFGTSAVAGFIVVVEGDRVVTIQ